MIKLPINGKWFQHNISDVLGQLWSSLNLNLFQNEGHTRVSPRTIITTDDITDLGIPVAFAVFTDTNGGVQYAWAVAGGYVFRMNLGSGFQTAFAKDSSTGTPNNVCSSDVSDMVSFGDNDYLFVTTTTDIYRFDPATGQWTDYTASPLSSVFVHLLCVFGSRIYVTDDNKSIFSFTTAFNDLATSSTYTLDVSLGGDTLTLISTMRPASRGIWVGTINQSESGCRVYFWDGASADDPNESFFIKDASGVLAMVIKDDTPWLMDNNGWLRYFNGGTFVKAPSGKLPVKNSKFLKNSLSAVNDRWIHPNGMELVDGRINILVNNEHEDNGATIDENFPSGVWEYSEETGWIHKMSLSLYTSSVADHGQNRISRVGALYANKTENTNASSNGTMLLGAQLYSDASATKEVIAIDDSNDTVQKYGYFVTSKIYSSQIRDTWQKVYLIVKKLLDSSDKIVVKCRNEEDPPVEATITWTSTTTCTTTTNVSAYIGYEMEVLQGKGGGKCSRITNVTESGGTYTITLAETFTGASSGTAKARFQYWKESAQFNSQTDDVAEFPLSDMGASPWIQIKVCMQFTGEDEVDSLVLSSSVNQKAE